MPRRKVIYAIGANTKVAASVVELIQLSNQSDRTMDAVHSNCVSRVKQREQRLAFFEHVERSALIVIRAHVVHSHGVINRVGKVFGTDRFVGRVGGDPVA